MVLDTSMWVFGKTQVGMSQSKLNVLISCKLATILKLSLFVPKPVFVLGIHRE